MKYTVWFTDIVCDHCNKINYNFSSPLTAQFLQVFKSAIQAQLLWDTLPHWQEIPTSNKFLDITVLCAIFLNNKYWQRVHGFQNKRTFLFVWNSLNMGRGPGKNGFWYFPVSSNPFNWKVILKDFNRRQANNILKK